MDEGNLRPNSFNQPKFFLCLPASLFDADVFPVEASISLGWNSAYGIVSVRVHAAAEIGFEMWIHGEITFYDRA